MKEAIRSGLLAEHRETIESVSRVADVVAGELSMPADRGTVESSLEYGLRETGVFEQFVDVIRGAVAAADRKLLAEPVAASPYVVVTGRGPLLRVTVEDARIVVCFEVFERVEKGDGGTDGYVRGKSTPGTVLSVVVHED